MNRKIKKKRKIWQCQNCAEVFKNKSALVEHLIDEFYMATQETDNCENQLEELNVKNY